MEQEEIIVMKLEDLSNILHRRVNDLERIKRDLDEIAELIGKVDAEEKKFSEIFSETNNLNERLLIYFEGIDIHKDHLLSLNKQLRSIESEINEKEIFIQNEITNNIFNKMSLSKYCEQLILFLKNKEDHTEKIRNEHKNIFYDSADKIVEKIKIIERLIAALIRKIEKVPENYGLKEYLGEKQNQVRQIMDILPLKLEDLTKRGTEDLRGLYVCILNRVFSCKDDLIRFAVENDLLEKDEIAILETIYGMKQREFDFNEITESLKKEISSKSYEEIQAILLSLSRKGFLVLKVFSE